MRSSWSPYQCSPPASHSTSEWRSEGARARRSSTCSGVESMLEGQEGGEEAVHQEGGEGVQVQVAEGKLHPPPPPLTASPRPVEVQVAEGELHPLPLLAVELLRKRREDPPDGRRQAARGDQALDSGALPHRVLHVLQAQR